MGGLKRGAPPAVRYKGTDSTDGNKNRSAEATLSALRVTAGRGMLLSPSDP